MTRQTLTTLILVSALCGSAFGQLSEQLLITEIMWKSGNPTPDDFGDGGYAEGDWWELTNVSDQAIDMTGFLWDDDDRLEDDDYTIFPEFVIQPSEAVIVVQESEGNVEHPDGFRAIWALPEDIRIISRSFIKGTDAVSFQDSVNALQQRSLEDISAQLDLLTPPLADEDRMAADELVQEALLWTAEDVQTIVTTDRDKIDQLVDLRLAGRDVDGEGCWSYDNCLDTFSGISSGGDELNLYDAERNLIHSIEVGEATTGSSTAWGFENGMYEDLGISESGDFEAYTAISDGSGGRLVLDDDFNPTFDEEGNPVIDPDYFPEFLDVASPGKVFGFDVIFPEPGGNEVDIDVLCSQIAAGESSLEDLATKLVELGSLPGDADLNGTVEFPDFLTMSGNFGSEDAGGSFREGDFDCNGAVEFPDFLALSGNFGQSAAVAAVPEPATGTMLLTISAMLLACFRGRKRA